MWSATWHSAVDGGHVGATRALLEHGANPMLRFDGISALQLAAESPGAGRRKLVAMLSDAAKEWEARRAAGLVDWVSDESTDESDDDDA